MMKSFVFACVTAIASLAVAADRKIEAGTPINFPKAKHDAKKDTLSEGKMGEIMVTETTDDGELQQIWLVVTWKTGNNDDLDWKKGQWVQNYLQIQDQEGKHLTMTCNTEYKRDNEKTANKIVIENFFGEESFKVSDNKNDKKWDARGEAIQGSMKLFDKDETGLIKDGYQGLYDSGDVYW